MAVTISEVFTRKLNNLIEEREARLDVFLIIKVQEKNGDVHMIFKKHFDGSFVVWSSYYTGELKTSYENLYRGSYDLDIFGATKELGKRARITNDDGQSVLKDDRESNEKDVEHHVI